MSGSVNAIGNVSAANAVPSAAPAARPPAPTAPAPAAARDGVTTSAARGAAPATVSLEAAPAAPSPVNFARLARGLQSGRNFGVGATGFFGSFAVGGEGRVVAMTPDRINLNFHVSAPGVDRRETMSFTWQAGAFTARDGARFNAAASNGGNTITMTNQANPRQRVVFTSPEPGVLNMTSYGFEPAGEGKTLQFRAR